MTRCWKQGLVLALLLILMGTGIYTARAQFVRTVANGIFFYGGLQTPAATAATIGVATQSLTVTGVAVGDIVVLMAAPTPTALCPPVGSRVTAANTVSQDWFVGTAVACTPAPGNYIYAAFR